VKHRSDKRYLHKKVFNLTSIKVWNDYLVVGATQARFNGRDPGDFDEGRLLESIPDDSGFRNTGDTNDDIIFFGYEFTARKPGASRCSRGGANRL